MMLFHFSDSATWNLPSSAGVVMNGSVPVVAVVLLHRRTLGRLDQDVVQLVDDRRRRVRRHVGREPEAHVVALDARFVDGRQLGRERRALRRGHAQARAPCRP